MVASASVSPPSLRDAGAVELDLDADILRRHFDAGVRLYDEGRYAEALAEFDEVEGNEPLAPVTYHRALCLDQLGRGTHATAAYRAYLEQRPFAPEADEVRARIIVLNSWIAARATRRPTKDLAPPLDGLRRIARARPAAALDAATPAAPPPPSVPVAAPDNAPPPPVAVVDPPAEATRSRPLTLSTRRYIAPAVVGGVGFVSALVGAVLVGTVQPRYDALAASCSPRCTDAAIDPLALQANAGYGVLGVASAAVLTDVVLWIVTTRGKPGRDPKRDVAMLRF